MPMNAAARRPLAEVMEERILHSADLLPGGLVAYGVGSALELTLAPLAQPQAALSALDSRQNIVFVDSRSAGTLPPDLTSACEVVTIASGDDGLARVGEVLSARQHLGVVHLVTYGSADSPGLGRTVLDSGTLLSHAAEIAGWARALDADSRLVLHTQADAPLPADAVHGHLGNLQSDLSALTGVVVDTATMPLAVAPSAPLAAVALQLSGLALNFETNRGQASAGIDFIARGSGYDLSLQDGSATLVLKGGGATATVQMLLQGATPDAPGLAEGEVTSRTNYLFGPSGQWLQNVPNHASVRYSGVYDGVDVRYYGNQRQLEYDFVVAAGADAGQIALRFNGAEKIAINGDGALELVLPDGTGSGRSIRFEAPLSYQDGSNGREAVTSHYVLADDGSVRFALGPYDPSRPLVIDPTLAYGTYFGTTGSDSGTGIAVDASGAVYLSGYTNAKVSTGHVELGTLAGIDAFVTKYDAVLSTAIFTTYFGGVGADQANGIAVNAAGQAYVVGTTESPLFFGNVISGTDAFVVKLAADGASIVYARNINNGLNDEGNAIAIGASGEAYVAVTAGTGTATDATVVKLNAAGSASLYTFTVAGNGTDSARAIAVNAAGQAVITGETQSTNLGAYLVNAFDTSLSNTSDAFVIQLNAAGSAVTYGTLFGGNQTDAGNAVAYGPGGKIYLVGETVSNNLSTTSGAFQTSRSPGISSDAFLAVFDPALSGSGTRVYSTYLAGNGEDYGRAVGVDAAGLVYVVGSTSSTDLTATPGAAQTSNGGGVDGFFSILSPAGAGSGDLTYQTYLGGSGTDNIDALALGSGGKVVLGGTTASTTGIARAGGDDTTFGGATDAFAVSFSAQATLIVDTAADISDGNITSISALLGNRGADGKISLREAIIATNNTPNGAGGPDQILFSIGGGGNATINLASALPAVTNTVMLDGTSQGGYAGSPLIQITGNGTVAGDGLVLSATASGSTVQGFVINRFGGNGISVLGGGNVIQGNYIGTNLAGNAASSNSGGGLYIISANNLIGGTSATERNVISGNGVGLTPGIELFSPGATGNRITGNYIGVNALGNAAIPNAAANIVIYGGANSNFIGGSAAGAGNVISGVSFPLSNAIYINAGFGNVIQGNKIGTNASGTAAIPNAYAGVLIDSSINNIVGGTVTGAGNVIANSSVAHGVAITGTGATGNSILGNSIYGNTQLGIDINNSFSPYLNDGTKSASLANAGMDSPVFTSAIASGGNVQVSGYVGSAAGQPAFGGARVEFFIADPDPSGYGEGKTYLGFLTADAAGNFSGRVAAAGAAVGNTLTATATDAGGNSSEFGDNWVITSNFAPVLSGANPLTTVNEDAFANGGTLVSTLIAGQVTDANVGDPRGIAVVGVNNTFGTWQYSTNAGASWSPFGSPSGSNARLLLADASTYVRFVPQANWNGSLSSGLTLRAWDASSGAVGATADTSPSGLGTAFSATTAAAGVIVASVNDAPAGANNSVGTAQNTPYTFSVADFGFSDTSDSPANALLSVRIGSLPAVGVLSSSGTPVVAGQTLSAASITAGLLVFTPVSGQSGAPYASFTFQVRDDGGTANGGLDLDPTARTLTVNVSAPANTAPVITSNGGGATAAVLVAENTSAVTLVTATDADLPAQPLSYSISGGADALKFGINAATGALSFIAPPNFEAPTDAGANNVYDVTVRVTDGALSDTQAISVTVGNVNEAPAGATPIPDQRAIEDLAFTFTVAGGTFTDPDAGDVLRLEAALITGAPLPAWLTFNATTGTFSGTPANGDVAAIAVRVIATDAANASVSGTFTLAVANTNDAPTGLPTVSGNATVRQTLTASTTAIADADGLGPFTLQWLRNGSDIVGATGSSYALGDADLGARISVRASYTDARGTAEVLASAATAPVTRINTAPVLAAPIADQSTRQDTVFAYALAGGTFTDADVSDALSYSATLAGGAQLPPWLGFDAGTGIFSGAPASADVGRISVLVTATDKSGASAQASFGIVVSPTAPKPQVPSVQPAAPNTQPSVLTAEAAATPTPQVAPQPTVDARPAPTPVDPKQPAKSGPADIIAAPLPASVVLTTAPAFAAFGTIIQAPFDAQPTVAPATVRLSSREDIVFVNAPLTQFTQISTTALTQLLRGDEITRKFEELQRRGIEQGEARHATIGSSMVVTGGLSVGYVVWLLRGGVLVSSMLSALPAWQMVDPLPVLSAARPRKGTSKGGKDDDASVEGLFDEKAKSPSRNPRVAEASIPKGNLGKPVEPGK